MVRSAQLVWLEPLHPIEDIDLGTVHTAFYERARENVAGTVGGPARVIVAVPHPSRRTVAKRDAVCPDLARYGEQHQLDFAVPRMLHDHRLEEAGFVSVIELALACQFFGTQAGDRDHRGQGRSYLCRRCEDLDLRAQP